jgi:hypothetical protein
MLKTTAFETFPWLRCRPGESFFVPSLTPYDTMHRGLCFGQQVLGFKEKLEARPGSYRGRLGVLFSVAPRPQPR